MYITLEDAKDQLLIRHSNTAHDAKLTRLIKATEKWAGEFLNAELSDYEDSDESPPRLQEDIMNGMLMHLEAHFDKDEKTMDLYIRRAENLLWPHRTGLGV